MNKVFMAELRLDDIVVSPRLQVRFEMDEERIAHYAEIIDQLPPPTVFLENETHWLAGGFHRLAACRRAGRFTITAEVRVGTFDDAFLFAAGDNLTHGLPLSNRDKERTVRLFLEHEDWSKRSSRWIALKAGVSHTFVDRVRGAQSKAVATEQQPNRPPEKNQVATVATWREGQDGDSCPSAVSDVAGKAVEPEKPAAPDAARPAPQAAGEPQIIRDGVGLPVAPDKRLIFTQTLGKFEAVLSAVRQLGRAIDELAKMPGGELVQRRCELFQRDGKETFRAAHVQNLIGILSASQPHVSICPSCAACGKPASCKVCHGLGWITEDAWHNLPENLRAKTLEAAGE